VKKKYSATYKVDFFTAGFFILSGFGFGAPRTLLDLSRMPAVGTKCSGGAFSRVHVGGGAAIVTDTSPTAFSAIG